MTTRGSKRRRNIALVGVAGLLVLAGCGGGDAASSDDSAAEPPAAVVADAVTISPEADVPTNLLPDLVVDHLGDDNKVNLRNYGTGDRPILLWMWAPH